MRKIMIAGNWKMHKTVPEAVALVEGLKEKVGDAEAVEVAVAPPFTALTAVHQVLKGSRIALAAQNLHYEKEGAFTGEVSPVMVRSAGCRYVILGHSERRGIFGESSETVNRKVRSALDAGLMPILCAGESLSEREEGKTMEVVGDQLRQGLAGISDQEISRIVIAYEPIWAIGTGKTATPEQANEVHSRVRNLLSELYDTEVAARIRILYGGSVKPSNARELLGCTDIDGALVGGASLAVESFVGIVLAGTPS
ncbi:MAG: triose-phosphate isomerase [Deltaproteobacteria bacterium]|nr:triose-phosphate isomerase [Deltaproteobacteria bacterium]